MHVDRVKTHHVRNPLTTASAERLVHLGDVSLADTRLGVPVGTWATDKIIVVGTAGCDSSLLYYPNFTLLPQSALRVLPRRAPNLAWKDMGVILTVQPGRVTAVVPLPTPVHSRTTLAVSVHPRPAGVAASGATSRSTLKVHPIRPGPCEVEDYLQRRVGGRISLTVELDSF